MSVLNDSMGTVDRASLSSIFLEFCVKVRNNDPSILPEHGQPFNICGLSEKEHMELADALLENTSVTYLNLCSEKYMKCSAEAMAKYVRTSKCLQRMRIPCIRCLNRNTTIRNRYLQQRDEILCCFLSAIQESTSLKELHMELPRGGGPSNLAFENLLTHTQSLRSLSLFCPAACPGGQLEDTAMAAARSGLKKTPL
jgi:hypothetical protein